MPDSLLYSGKRAASGCLYYRRLLGKGIAALGIRSLVCCFCKVSECSELLGRGYCEVRGELQAKSIKISAQQWAQGSTQWKEFRVCANIPFSMFHVALEQSALNFLTLSP